MEITKNYGLNMPGYDDNVDIEKLNENTRIIDEELAKARAYIKEEVSEQLGILENVLKKIEVLDLKTEKILNTPILSGVDHNAFISEMALHGKLFILSSLHSSNINIEIAFPNYTRVVIDKEALHVENNAYSLSHPDKYYSFFAYYKRQGAFLFEGCRTPLRVSGGWSISQPLEEWHSGMHHAKYPIDILNSVSRTEVEKSHYVAFVLDNLEDLDKITVQVKDSETDEILNDVVQLNQVTSISIKHVSACTRHDWTYNIIKTF